MVYGTKIGKTSEASQPTAMGVLESMEWQYDLDSRGRHLAKAASLSTSDDNQRVQWHNRTKEWSMEHNVIAIPYIIPGWQYGAEGIRQKRLV